MPPWPSLALCGVGPVSTAYSLVQLWPNVTNVHYRNDHVSLYPYKFIYEDERHKMTSVRLMTFV
jgi:hypothetical protein